ncbi:MAG: dihydroneopterin aldolase [Muribaculaceae bacterium]|nr:dihydroneopterin aldolase [Muribaculaceae bacterium]
MECFIISLKDCRFYAFHGVMAHESEAGNEFNINLSVEYPVISPLDDEMNNSLSYADLYEIAEREMMMPRKLLETVAYRIADTIRNRWTLVRSIEVEISKVNPPIPGITGSSTVRYHWNSE